MKKYYQDNKEKYQQYSKAYKEQNIDKIREYAKEYKIINKEKVDKYNCEKITCDCGGSFCRKHRAAHFKTIKHLKFVSSQTTF
jgi:hypothetical protein